MPRYHSLDTEVQLCTWDSLSRVSRSSEPVTPTPGAGSLSTCRLGIPKDAFGINSKICPNGQDLSDGVNRLTEEFFKGLQGLDFLGFDTPFFFIFAGHDSLHNKKSANHQKDTKTPLYQSRETSRKFSEKLLGLPSSNRNTIISKVGSGTPGAQPTINQSQQYPNYANNVILSPSGSSLPNTSSAEFLSPKASNGTSGVGKVQLGGETTAYKTLKRTTDELGTQLGAPKSELVIQPLELIVKLSEKSFISPIFGTESDHYDICINIFYNGQFNTSQVIEYKTWTIKKSDEHFSFGGRQIETNLELPWTINGKIEDIRSSVSPAGDCVASSAPSGRWNKIAMMLLTEANEWGRNKRGYRFPTGQYLELISKKAMPLELENPLVCTIGGFGIIDVVITLGRSRLNTAKLISTSSRNLPPTQLRPYDMLVGAQGEKRVFIPSLATSTALSIDQRQPHPHRPENVPQKRYQGSEPSLPLSPPSKRRKKESLFAELPYELNTSTYMSTRARRSASIPSVRTPQSSLPEVPIKRKRSGAQIKSTLSNTDSSEASIARTPFTPEKNDPKTPESSCPLKKKPRSTGHNPKLSNRPQNLRRKNSAGEWVAPPCRKNSLGEWETPTKGGQIKLTTYAGGDTEGATIGSGGKIARPVFTLSGENASEYKAAGKDPVGENLSKHHQNDLNGSGQLESTIKKASRLVLTFPAMKNKENMRVRTSADSQPEIAITPSTPKILSSTLGHTIPGLKNDLRLMEDIRNGDLGTPRPTKDGAVNLKNNCQSGKIGAGFSGAENFAHKSLVLKFLKGKVDSAGKAVNNGDCHTRWFVKLCSSPENVPAPGSGKKPASYPLFEVKKPITSALNGGPKGEKVTDVLTDPEISRSRRGIEKAGNTESGTANSPIDTNLRESWEDMPQNRQLPAIKQSRPRFAIPSHNPTVLKLVSRKPVATKSSAMKYEAQEVPHSVRNEHADSSNESAIILASKTEIFERNSSGAIQMPAERIGPKRPFRPRTVGPLELKALLESHDYDKVASPSPESSMGMTPSHPLTRASRRASISFKPRKGVEVVVNTPASSSIPAAERPLTSSSAPKKRSSSSNLAENAMVAAVPPKHAKDTSGGPSTAISARRRNRSNIMASIFEVSKPSSRTPNGGKQDPAGNGTVEARRSKLSETAATSTLEKAAPRSLKVLEFPKETVPDFGGTLGGDADDSVLGYVTDGMAWKGLERSSATGQWCRSVGTQEEAFFEEFGVLMGVRYVVVGSAVMK